jgi:Flp pilus assembly pilin Flp
LIGAFTRLLVDDEGAAMTEYAIITAGISIAALIALQATGLALNLLYSGETANWASAAHSGQ